MRILKRTVSDVDRLGNYYPVLQVVVPVVTYAAVMAVYVHNKGIPWEVQQNGTLAPVDRLRNERSESPTPGLVVGTEPGGHGYSNNGITFQ